MEKLSNATRRRRHLLCCIGGVAASASALPHAWKKPLVNAVFLPAHAQTSSAAPTAREIIFDAKNAGTAEIDTAPYIDDDQTPIDQLIVKVVPESISDQAEIAVRKTTISYQYKKAGFAGEDQFEYFVEDPDGNKSVSNFIKVQNVKVADTGISARNIELDATQTATADYDLTPDIVTDTDVAAVKVIITKQATDAQIAVRGQTVSYEKTAAGFEGEDSFSFQLEADNGSLSEVYTARVLNVKVAAKGISARDIQLDAAQTEMATYDLTPDIVTDTNVSAVRVIITKQAVDAQIAVKGQTVSYEKTAAGFEGEDSFSFQLEADNGSLSEVYTARVLNVKVAKKGISVGNIEMDAARTATASYDLTRDVVTDTDLKAVKVSIMKQAKDANVSARGLTLNYEKTSAGFSGEDSFSFQLEADNGSLSEIRTARVLNVVTKI